MAMRWMEVGYGVRNPLVKMLAVIPTTHVLVEIEMIITCINLSASLALAEHRAAPYRIKLASRSLLWFKPALESLYIPDTAVCRT